MWLARYLAAATCARLCTSRYRLWAAVFGDDGHHRPDPSREVSLVGSKTVTSGNPVFSASQPFWFMRCLASQLSGPRAKSIVYYINYYAGHPESVSDVMSIGILGAGIDSNMDRGSKTSL